MLNIKFITAVTTGLLAALTAASPAVAVDGDPAAPDQHRFMASIHGPNGRVCSGVVIKPNWVLSSSLCLTMAKAAPNHPDTRVHIGGSTSNSYLHFRHPSTILHHSFSLSGDTDLALIGFGDVVPDFIPIATDEIEVDEQAGIIGYGSDDKILRFATTNRWQSLASPYCSPYYDPSFSVNLCFKPAKNQQADRGGPIIKPVAGSDRKVVGIIRDKSLDQQTTYAADPVTNRDWIEDNTQAVTQLVAFDGVVHQRTVAGGDYKLTGNRFSLSADGAQAPSGRNNNITGISSFVVDGTVHQWVIQTINYQSLLYTRVGDGAWFGGHTLPGEGNGEITHFTTTLDGDTYTQAYWRTGTDGIMRGYMREDINAGNAGYIPGEGGESSRLQDFEEKFQRSSAGDALGDDILGDLQYRDQIDEDDNPNTNVAHYGETYFGTEGEFVGGEVVSHVITHQRDTIIQALTVEVSGKRHAFIRNIQKIFQFDRTPVIDWGCGNVIRTFDRCLWNTSDGLAGDAIELGEGAITGQTQFSQPDDSLPD